MSHRTRQVGEFLREEISDIIRKEVDDPRVGFVSVTEVEVTDDIRFARVYISVLGSDEEREATLTALRSAAPYIRRHLRPRLSTRNIPDIDFRDDRSMEHAETIARTLYELRTADAQRAARRGTMTVPGDDAAILEGQSEAAQSEDPTE